MAYARGSNPVWLMDDLTGNLLDDTYWMFVLQNTIPYIPAYIYADPNGTPLNNPIQFLANGTLPIDIYFDTTQVYRLEIRKGNTQYAPLIYEVDNYQPTTGGSINPSTASFSIDNQFTNPQFALVNFKSTLSQSNITNPAPIEIAPGWYLNLTGTGNYTVTQIALNSTEANPTNAPYALEISINGTWTGTPYLSQRFEQNGMLWANEYVSSSITCYVNGAAIVLNAVLYDSNGTLLGNVLSNATINSVFQEYTGVTSGPLPATTNTNTPPTAWIEYRLLLPTTVDIVVTSFQLIPGNLPVQYNYTQDTVNRQIDQTYNTAYPIVPVGTIIEFGGYTSPLAHYLLCDGTAYSRILYNLLYLATTLMSTVTLASSNTYTDANAPKLYIGQSLEGTGIPASTTITNISGTTITISNAATISGSSVISYFAYGNGNGTDTFNVPNDIGIVIAGAGGTLFGTGYNGLGYTGGSGTQALQDFNLPQHVHTVSTGAQNYLQSVPSGGVGALTTGGAVNVFPTTGVNTSGTATAFSIVQKTGLRFKYIRYE